jgi:hypothetical protein
MPSFLEWTKPFSKCVHMNGEYIQWVKINIRVRFNLISSVLSRYEVGGTRCIQRYEYWWKFVKIWTWCGRPDEWSDQQIETISISCRYIDFEWPAEEQSTHMWTEEQKEMNLNRFVYRRVSLTSFWGCTFQATICVRFTIYIMVRC